MSLNTQLRKAREQAGWTQKEIAARSGIAHSAISRFESGKAGVTTATLETLADSLGVSLVAVPGRINAAADVARFVASRLADGSTASAFRGLIQFSDDLRSGNTFTTALSVAVEPDSTGDPHFDAAIAGLAEIRLAELGLESPAWVTSESRYAELAEDSLGYHWSADDFDDTDPVLRSHGVVLPRQTLASV
ncbi:helix-turn-helix domain-containing protein [Leifsonia sp. LS-T14]|uniref:helix-turn-helix domain-containing protein n=1 Tax=unclassified Leifsonia TaxID=2663824 RepID=UPI0035A6D022